MMKIEKIETFNKGVNFKRWVFIESDRELNMGSKINKILHVGNSEMGFCSILERGGFWVQVVVEVVEVKGWIRVFRRVLSDLVLTTSLAGNWKQRFFYDVGPWWSSVAWWWWWFWAGLWILLLTWLVASSCHESKWCDVICFPFLLKYFFPKNLCPCMVV